MCFGCEHDTTVTLFWEWLGGRVEGRVGQGRYWRVYIATVLRKLSHHKEMFYLGFYPTLTVAKNIARCCVPVCFIVLQVPWEAPGDIGWEWLLDDYQRLWKCHPWCDLMLLSDWTSTNVDYRKSKGEGRKTIGGEFELKEYKTFFYLSHVLISKLWMNVGQTQTEELSVNFLWFYFFLCVLSGVWKPNTEARTGWGRAATVDYRLLEFRGV